MIFFFFLNILVCSKCCPACLTSVGLSQFRELLKLQEQVSRWVASVWLDEGQRVPCFLECVAGCGRGLLTQVQEPMATPRAGATGLVRERRSGRLLTEGTTEDQLCPDDLCLDGPGSWVLVWPQCTPRVLAWASVYTPVGLWRLLKAAGNSELWSSWAGRWEASLLHHPRPLIFQTGVHAVSTLWAQPGPAQCSWAAAGWGVSTGVPWVGVGISSR